MRTLYALGLASVLAISITLTYAAQSSTAGFGPPQGQIISCSSNDMRRNYCAADVRGWRATRQAAQ